MFYSDDIVEEVRTRNDIVDVISEYTGLKKAGNSYKCCCPFHNEKTPSFTVSKEKQMYHCFGCGAGGNVYTFVMKYENFTFQEAIQFLAKRAGITLPEKELTPAEKAKIGKKQAILEANKMAAAYFHYLLTKTERGSNAYKYYRERGYTDETIMKFGLGYADIYSDDLYKFLKSKGFSEEVLRDAGLVEIDERRGVHDVFWNRVIVPIADINDKIIAFGGRVLGDGLPKYVNTKETDVFSKSRNLFAMNIARKSRRRGVILCEGYMDVIAQHQAGFDNAIASLGTAFTEAQAGLIKRYTGEVYLAYDNDEAGRKALMRAIEILRNHDMIQRVISLAPYKDPDEFIKNMGKEAYEERIRDAIPGRIFEIDRIASGYNLSDPDEKTKFMHSAATLLAGIEDPELRITFDTNIRWRTKDMDLTLGGQGRDILEPGQVLMELKIAGSVPLELSRIFSELKIYQTSFSKYGRGFEILCAEDTRILMPAPLPAAACIAAERKSRERRRIGGLFRWPLPLLPGRPVLSGHRQN